VNLLTKLPALRAASEYAVNAFTCPNRWKPFPGFSAIAPQRATQPCSQPSPTFALTGIIDIYPQYAPRLGTASIFVDAFTPVRT
jgi:hypothetical protein